MTDPLLTPDETPPGHSSPNPSIAPRSLQYEVPGTTPHHFPAWNAASAAILIILACCLGLFTMGLLAAVASELGARHPDITKLFVLSLFAFGLGIAAISSSIGAKRHLQRARGKDR